MIWSRTLELLDRGGGAAPFVVRPPLHDGALWLVRPDGYAACSATDAGVVAEYLDGLVSR